MQQGALGLAVPKLASLALTFAVLLFASRLKRFAWFYALLIGPATLMHELTHWLVGWASGAHPTRLSIWPTRVGITRVRLGCVSFANAGRLNGGAAALAPLLLFPALVALYRFVLPMHMSLVSFGIHSFFLAWLFEGAWPSRTDWRLAFACWPGSLLFISVWFGLLALVIPMSPFPLYVLGFIHHLIESSR